MTFTKFDTAPFKAQNHAFATVVLLSGSVFGAVITSTATYMKVSEVESIVSDLTLLYIKSSSSIASVCMNGHSMDVTGNQFKTLLNSGLFPTLEIYKVGLQGLHFVFTNKPV